MGLIKTIAIIMLVYYLLKIVGRFTLPFFAKRFMSKMEDQMRKQQGFEKEEKTTIGETTIDKKATEKTSNKNVGEYVDFEDVE